MMNIWLKQDEMLRKERKDILELYFRGCFVYGTPKAVQGLASSSPRF
jgi:hypothetical protein